ncbi:MAG: PQQ-dependent sugar dehydrogenase, partial [Actinomycetota bacterium]
ASDLEFPTNLAFAPDERIFFTEKNTGRVRIIEDGRLLSTPFVTVSLRKQRWYETGLLGLALHPSFPSEPWVYLYYSSPDRNLLVRVRAEGNEGTDVETILRGLPVSQFHVGGDMAFGPDGLLYVAVGDSTERGLAQDPGSIGGKILRLRPDGSLPPDNPIGPDSPVYSMGHRNSFGLCFDPETGNLWETENGPTAHDEVNLIEAGGNYGWPIVLGPGGEPPFIDPVLDFPGIIIPTGCAFYGAPSLGRRSEGALFFGTLRGILHRAMLSPDRRGVRANHRFLTGLPGITDVQMGPDGRLYLATVESILRLPRKVPKQPPQAPSADEHQSTPPMASGATRSGERFPVSWIVGGAAALAAVALAWRARRKG